MEIDKRVETSVVEDAIRVPVDDLQYSDDFKKAFVFSGGKPVGYVDCVRGARKIYYQVRSASNGNLDWPSVFHLFEEDINKAVSEKVGTRNLSLKPGTSWRLVHGFDETEAEAPSDPVLTLWVSYKDNRWTAKPHINAI